MKLKLVFTLSVFIVLVNTGFSQRVILGKILDERTGEPINEVTIEADKSGVKTSSNFRGYFQIQIDSSSSLLFKKAGYYDANLEIPEEDKFQLYLKPLVLDNAGDYFKGGGEAYSRFLAENLRYPVEARRRGFQGLFFTSFEIDSLGELSNIEILNAKGDLGGLDLEIERVLASSSGFWNPSNPKINIVIPIRFKLEGGVEKGYEMKYLNGKIVLNELIVTSKMLPNSFSPSQNKGLEVANNRNEGGTSITFISNGGASSIREIYKDPNKSKLIIRNKRLDGFSALNQPLNHVKYLDIENCSASSLPQQLEYLPMLEEFYAPFNRLKALPTEFLKLKKLKVVGLGDNKFEQVPEELYQLDKLEMLDLGKNKIAFIDEEIAKLQHLKVLNLSHNKLRSLPSSIKELKNLERLYLKGNSIPKEEIKQLKEDMPKLMIKD
ncbi:hypothetical protein GCM10028791_05630 [Echinicola sediminis]